MEILIVYLVFAAIPALIAPSRGRRPGVWFLLAILISPLLAFLFVVLLPSKKEEQEARAQARDRRPCPRCGELIPRSASVCRFCNTEVAPLIGA